MWQEWGHGERQAPLRCKSKEREKSTRESPVLPPKCPLGLLLGMPTNGHW